MFAILLTAVSATMWARRGYYSDNLCQTDFVMGAQVLISGASCSQTTPLNSTCEIKSVDSLKSAEATGCENASPIVDTPYFPPAVAARLVNSNYITINQYSSATCDVSSASIEQDTFLANGQCHAVETQNSFFTATCQGSTASLKVCSDSACQKCGTQLNAGVFQGVGVEFTTNACTQVNGQTVKMFCSNPTLSLVAASNSTGGSTSPVPTVGPNAGAKSSATKIEMSLVALLGLFI